MSSTTSPTSSDTDNPDEVLFTTKINGSERPVTRQQAIRWAQQVGSLADQARVLAERQEDLDKWDRLQAGWSKDPDGTLAQLAEAAGGSYAPRGSTPKGAAALDDDDDEDPMIADLKAEIADLKNQFGQVYGDLSGFKAQTAIEKEIADLKSANPTMSDEDFRATISKVTTYGGLPLKEAYRLVKMEAIENGRAPEGSPGQDHVKLPTTSGTGTPASRVESDKSKLDYSKPLAQVLEDSWKLTASSLGIDPNS